MRTILLFCLLSTALGSNAQQASSEDLIAYFSFDERQIINQVWPEEIAVVKGRPGAGPGIAGNAIYFDGGPDRVIFDGRVNSFLSGNRDFTISFFMQHRDRGRLESVIGKRENCNGRNHFDIRVGNKLTVEVYEQDDPAIRANLRTPVPDNNWHHYVFVRDAFRVRLYVDGRQVDRNRSDYIIYFSDKAPLAINNSPCLENRNTTYFQGAIDELKVFKRALKADEVTELFYKTIN